MATGHHAGRTQIPPLLRSPERCHSWRTHLAGREATGIRWLQCEGMVDTASALSLMDKPGWTHSYRWFFDRLRRRSPKRLALFDGWSNLARFLGRFFWSRHRGREWPPAIYSASLFVILATPWADRSVASAISRSEQPTDRARTMRVFRCCCARARSSVA